MTTEQLFFLKILGDFISNKETIPPDNTNWDIILAYSKSHEVEGIVYNQCKSYLSQINNLDNIYQHLNKVNIICGYYYIHYVHAAREIKDLLNKKHIPFFTVKGLQVADYYPCPRYRTMGDLDFIMHSDDRDSIDQDMLSLGYSLINNSSERIYIKNKIHIEFHDHLIYKEKGEQKDILEYFNNFWDYITVNENGNLTLDWNFHFLYLIEHAKLHFAANGIGFRHFMDIAVIVQNCTYLDWNKIKKEANKIGLWDFTCMVLTYINRWWGLDISNVIDEGIEIDDEFYNTSTELIFSNGVFGYDNADHNIFWLRKTIKKYHYPVLINNILYTFHSIFFSYDYAKKLPYCSFVIGRKYLLPFAWIYHIFYIFIHRRESISMKGKLVLGLNKKAKEHEALLKHWGINNL